MRNIIQFSISKGENSYIAQAIDFPIFTQAESLDVLIENIKEATGLHFKDEDLSEYGFMPKPSLLINFEVPQYV
jgi:predicted RNase H-like HicB family nuclease